MTKSTDTDIIKKDAKQGAGEDAIEAVIADSASADPIEKAGAETEVKASGKSHGGRNFILIVLLIVVAVLGSLALSGKLAPLYDSVTSKLQNTSPQQRVTEKANVVSTKPVAVKTVANKPVLSPVVERVEQKPAVSAEEVRILLSSMNALHDELQQMSDAQQSLQNGLIEQQHMNLQVRLRWIADPASRLPQIQLAWEEISLLPGLSDGQRSQAVRMHALARSRVQQMKQWQDALSKWIGALATPVHRNILPEPEYPWLAWIVSQFQLRQAPSIEARHLGDLRDRLLDVARHLTLESWPAKGAWQSLQAKLLLQIKAMRLDSGDNNAEVVETGLPESFDAIQSDINTLRQTALQWQQGGGQ